MLVNPEDKAIADAFQNLYQKGAWPNTERYGGPCVYWRGSSIIKNPFDLMIYQEIIHDTKPDLIIETGTRTGGSAIFFADMQELNGIKPRVVTFDVEYLQRPYRAGVHYITGSSIDPALWGMFLGASSVLVSLDSDHSKDHVYQELSLYAPYLKKGNYMVVEDTSLNGHPVDPAYGPGPWEAVDEWLPHNPEFRPDYSREKLLFTSNPSGWLRRQ